MKPYFQNHILGKINGTYLQWKASTTSLRPLRVQFDSGLLIEILHRRILHVPKSELSISTSLRSIDRYRGCLINTGGYLNSLTVSGFRPCPCHVFTSKGPHVCFLSRLMPSKACWALRFSWIHWFIGWLRFLQHGPRWAPGICGLFRLAERHDDTALKVRSPFQTRKKVWKNTVPDSSKQNKKTKMESNSPGIAAWPLFLCPRDCKACPSHCPHTWPKHA